MASAGRQALLDLLRPGARVYVQGATGEPMDFVRLLEAEPARANGVTFVSCLVPGMNAFDYASLDDGARLETFMLSPALRASFAAGKTAILPLRYSLIAQRMAADAFDLAVLHVAPPDEAGLCSFGVACDFGPMAWPRAKRVAAFVNPAMPRLKRGPAIAFSSIDLVLEAETAPLHAPRATASEDLRAAAAHAAAFAPDGAAIQTGIGAAPAAILPFLKDRRGLRIASGMVSEEYRDLADAGALADRALHCTGIAWGGLDFYDYLAREDLTAFAVADVTHDVDMLGEIPAFISFGSALEADLFGQI
ncbi:MAG: hypothetical protein AB7L65_11275, partial [Hyphomonadaceae bacterium]